MFTNNLDQTLSRATETEPYMGRYRGQARVKRLYSGIDRAFSEMYRLSHLRSSGTSGRSLHGGLRPGTPEPS